MAKPTRVVLADEYPLVRRGLKVILEQDEGITVVGEAGTVREAEATVAAASPDVVLLDFMGLPRSGIKLIRNIKRAPAAPAVLVVTPEPPEDVLLPALDAGADGFMSMNGNHADYREMVHHVSAGHFALCPCAQSWIVHALLDAGRARDLGLFASLTAQERETLYATVCGFNTKEIAKKMSLPLNVVTRLKSHLREKLATHGREELVAFALRIDLLHRDSAYPWIGEHI